jgi:hypothetical protein
MTQSLDLNLTPNDVSKTSDDYYTPKWIFDALGLEFDTDPAQPIGGCSWIPVKRYYTIVDDGLSQEWVGRVWCNPPFSKPALWIDKFITHGNGIMLVTFSRSKSFINLWNKSDGIAALPSDLKFQTPSNGEKGIYMPTALFAMGADNVEALKVFGRVR